MRKVNFVGAESCVHRGSARQRRLAAQRADETAIDLTWAAGTDNNPRYPCNFTLPEVQYSKPVQRVAFFDDLLARVRALPRVEAASLVRAVPGEGYFGNGDVTVAEHPPLPQGQTLLAIDREADPGYFASMKIPFVRGHTFGSDQRLDGATEVHHQRPVRAAVSSK